MSWPSSCVLVQKLVHLCASCPSRLRCPERRCVSSSASARAYLRARVNTCVERRGADDSQNNSPIAPTSTRPHTHPPRLPFAAGRWVGPFVRPSAFPSRRAAVRCFGRLANLFRQVRKHTHTRDSAPCLPFPPFPSLPPPVCSLPGRDRLRHDARVLLFCVYVHASLSRFSCIIKTSPSPTSPSPWSGFHY